MRRVVAPLLVLALAGGALVRAEGEEEGGLSAADREVLTKAGAAWAAAVKARDGEALRRFYAADAALYAPNRAPLRGVDAIVEHLNGLPPVTGMVLEAIDVAGGGGSASVVGRYAMTLSAPGLGTMTDRGHYAEVWKKQADGSWRIVHDIYNSELSTPEVVSPPSGGAGR
jgi:ketosteroid isomerase-like protein